MGRQTPLLLPSYLLELRLGALHAREAPSNIQQAHVMPDPTAHLEYAPAVGDGPGEVVGILAAGAHVEADACQVTGGDTEERQVSAGRHTLGNMTQAHCGTGEAETWDTCDHGEPVGTHRNLSLDCTSGHPRDTHLM